ncbi:MAG: SBBP repeat-containing protein [Candidatus Thorarchaeota archaeon]
MKRFIKIQSNASCLLVALLLSATILVGNIPTSSTHAEAPLNEIGLNYYTLSADSNFTTYFGSTGAEDATKVAFDNDGNTLLIGQSQSNEMPTTTGVFQENRAGSDEPFIAKFSPSGALIFCTYLGGSSYEHITSINIDSSNNILVSGHTQSTNFPVTPDAYQSTYGGGGDGFIAKISPDGTQLLYSTYFGGVGEEWIYGLEVDASDNYLFSGYSSSDALATLGAYQTLRGGQQDAFVARLSSNGATLDFFSYYGGTSIDLAWSMTVDDSYNFVISGMTTSNDLPGVTGAFQDTYGGDTDTYLAKISSTGSSLVFSTYCGGSGTDIGLGVDVDSEGNIVLGGFVESEDMPVLNALYDTYIGGAYDMFISKFTGTGTALFSSYFGGSLTDQTWDLRVNNEDAIIIIGRTMSLDYPTVNASQHDKNNNYDAVVTKFAADGQSILISTYLGGSSEDIGEGIAVDGEGHVVVSGRTSSVNLEVTSDAHQADNAGDTDSFVCHTALDVPVYATPHISTETTQTDTTTSDTTTEPGFAIDSSFLLIGAVAAIGIVSLVIAFFRKRN